MLGSLLAVIFTVSTPTLDADIHPRLVAAAPNGNVWFAAQTNTIGFFTPSGHVTSFAIPCAKCASGAELVYVWGLAADRDGSVWFIDNHAHSDGTSIDSAIGHVTESGNFAFFAIPTKNATAIVPGGFGQSSIAIAPDGTIWFTENATFAAGRLTPSTGQISEYPLEAPEQPTGITVGPDGKVWYAVGDHEIAQITPPTNGEFVEFSLGFGANPLSLAVGSDGNLWVTETGRSKIARFQPSGIVNELQPPAINGEPQHIVAAPDGTLWFTEAAGRDVVRVMTSGVFEAVPTGQENFDITVTPNNVVYVTTQQNQLLKIEAALSPRRRSARH